MNVVVVVRASGSRLESTDSSTMADKQDILPPCVSAGATFIRMITHSLTCSVCVCYVHLPGFHSIEHNDCQQCRVVCGVTWKVNWQLEFIMHPLCQSVCVCQETNRCPHANELAVLLNDCVSIQIPFLHACFHTAHLSQMLFCISGGTSVYVCVFGCLLLNGWVSISLILYIFWNMVVMEIPN